MNEFEGFEEFIEELENFEDDVEEAKRLTEEAADRATEEVAERYARDIRQAIAEMGLVDDGDLINSIQEAKEGDARYRVFTTEDHALYLEYGTDGPITPNNSQYLKFENEQGETIFRKSVEGVEAHKFWRKTQNHYRDRSILGKEVRDEIEDALEEAFGG